MDPELLKALSAAGMTEEQLRMLAPQLQLGQEMMQPQHAGGREVGSGPFRTFVASSPLEHLANAMSQGAGAYIANKVQGRQQELLAQQQKGRQSAFQGLQTALSGGQGGTLGAPAGGAPYDQFAGATPNGGGPTRSPDPQAAQALMTAMAGSGDQALQAGAHFGLQQQNLQREQSLLQNTLRHQTSMERMEQEKIDQGKYTPIKDMFGNVTSLLEGKTGKVLPLSTAGAAPRAALTPEARDMLAKMGAATGTIPSVGRGNAATATAMEIANQMASAGGGAPNLASNKAGNKADTASLAKAQTQADAIESFENTALKNLDQFLTTAHGVIDTGSPLLNAPIRSLSNKVMGDTNMTKFNTARQVAIQEISKVLGGAVSGGAVTEGQRHEVEGLIRGDASVAQIEAAANILKTDMANRKAAVQQQLQTIRGRISGQPAQAAETAPPPPQKATHRFNAATGKIEAIP